MSAGAGIRGDVCTCILFCDDLPYQFSFAGKRQVLFSLWEFSGNFNRKRAVGGLVQSGFFKRLLCCD